MRVRGDKSAGGERGLKVGREYFNVYFHTFLVVIEIVTYLIKSPGG